MMMIPFALIGAVLGHYVMGLTMTILSLFALIALAGIVVNNSIILVSTIERRMEDAQDRIEAIVSGTADRLRPVILTSVTTICGLSTLMFERSLQAQFLIPMATTIVFGLAITTLLVLFVVPAALATSEDVKTGFRKLGGNLWDSDKPVIPNVINNFERSGHFIQKTAENTKTVLRKLNDLIKQSVKPAE
jgi:Cu/Ag efflux pump CusA